MAAADGRDLESGDHVIYVQARRSGSLKLANKGLVRVPGPVFRIQDKRAGDEKWWESEPLRRLDLSGNSIREIPDGVKDMADLTMFRASRNALHAVSSFLLGIPSLKLIDLSHNRLRTIPPILRSGAAPVVEMHLMENELESLPVGLEALANTLEVLDVSSNRIGALPDTLGEFQKLRVLRASQNRLISVPDSIGMLGSATELDLSRNRIASLPGDLRGLTSLVRLDLRANQLEVLPSVPRTTTLDALHLAENRLCTISPEALGAAPCLGVLDLRDNRLADLPQELGRLTGLHTLDLRNNDLRSLHYSIGYMPALSRVQLDGNPMRAMRKALNAQGADDLKRYLRTRAPPEEADVLEEQMLAAEAAREGRKVRGGFGDRRAGAGEGTVAAGAASGGTGWGASTGTGTAAKGGHSGTSRGGMPGTGASSGAASGTSAAASTPACAPTAQAPTASSMSMADWYGALEDASRQRGHPDWAMLCRDASSEGVLAVGGMKPPGLPGVLFATMHLHGLRAVSFAGCSGLPRGQLPAALDRLPEACPELRVLDVSECGLAQLFPAMAQLPKLKELLATGNPLSEEGADALVAGAAGSGEEPPVMDRLRTIDLSRCRLRRLPTLLGSCPELEELRLGYNSISIPSRDEEELLAIPTLVRADLGNNALQAVPRRLLVLPRLEELSVENNDIRQVDPLLGRCNSLKALRIGGNPQRGLRQELLSRGTPAVLEYLSSRCRESEAAAFEAERAALRQVWGAIQQERDERRKRRELEEREREEAAIEARMGKRPGDFARGARLGPRPGMRAAAERRAEQQLRHSRGGSSRDSAPVREVDPRGYSRGGSSRVDAGSLSDHMPAARPPSDPHQLRRRMSDIEDQLSSGSASHKQSNELRKELAQLRGQLGRAGVAAPGVGGRGGSSVASRPVEGSGAGALAGVGAGYGAVGRMRPHARGRAGESSRAGGKTGLW